MADIKSTHSEDSHTSQVTNFPEVNGKIIESIELSSAPDYFEIKFVSSHEEFMNEIYTQKFAKTRGIRVIRGFLFFSQKLSSVIRVLAAASHAGRSVPS